VESPSLEIFQPPWPRCCAPCSGWPCLGRGLGGGPRGPCQPLPCWGSVILWDTGLSVSARS